MEILQPGQFRAGEVRVDLLLRRALPDFLVDDRVLDLGSLRLQLDSRNDTVDALRSLSACSLDVESWIGIGLFIMIQICVIHSILGVAMGVVPRVMVKILKCWRS